VRRQCKRTLKRLDGRGEVAFRGQRHAEIAKKLRHIRGQGDRPSNQLDRLVVSPLAPAQNAELMNRLWVVSIGAQDLCIYRFGFVQTACGNKRGGLLDARLQQLIVGHTSIVPTQDALLLLRVDSHQQTIRKANNDPDGTRTRVTGVKGQCPRPLDDGARCAQPKPRHHLGFLVALRRLVKGPARQQRYENRRSIDCAKQKRTMRAEKLAREEWPK
jgi:hypothetical protein